MGRPQPRPNAKQRTPGSRRPPDGASHRRWCRTRQHRRSSPCTWSGLRCCCRGRVGRLAPLPVQLCPDVAGRPHVLWTPGGEHPVDRADARNPRRAAARSFRAGTSPRRRAQAAFEQEMAALRASSSSARPTSSPTTLHALRARRDPPRRAMPPALDQAKVAIDAMAAVVEGVGSRLADAEPTLRDARPAPARLRPALPAAAGQSGQSTDESAESAYSCVATQRDARATSSVGRGALRALKLHMAEPTLGPVPDGGGGGRPSARPLASSRAPRRRERLRRAHHRRWAPPLPEPVRPADARIAPSVHADDIDLASTSVLVRTRVDTPRSTSR